MKGGISEANIARVDPAVVGRLAKHRVRTGDIILARRGEIGRCALIKPAQSGWLCGTGCLRLRLIPNIIPAFVLHLISHDHSTKWLQRNAVGQTMANLSVSIVGEMPIALPSVEAQQRIVDTLSAADGAFQAAAALMAAKEKHKRALAERLLTGRHRFPEFATQPWRKYRLGELFSERVETNRLDLKLLAVTSNNGVIDRDLLAKRDTSSEDKSLYRRVAPGDIVYNTMRMWQGHFGLSPVEGIVSPAYTVCVPNARIDGPYAAYLFKLPAQIALFGRYSQGLVSDTLNLKFPNFAMIELRIPSLPEQRRIAEVLGLCDKEIALLRRQLDILKKQKQALMQKLLTGEVRVKEFAP